MVDQLVTRLPERFLWSSLHQMDGPVSSGPPALFLLGALCQRRRVAAAGRAALSRLVSAAGSDALPRLPELLKLMETGGEQALGEPERQLVWMATAESLLAHVEKVGENGES